jgi:hypothetical protein
MRFTWRGLAPGVVLLAAAASALFVYGARTRHGPALVDEYMYLAGARYFAERGLLHARFYAWQDLVRLGYPHQDMHAPGYTLLLGAVSWLLSPGYWSAVALNVAAYLATAFLIVSLGRAIGLREAHAAAAGVLALLLPAFLPYTFWVLFEVPHAALFAAAFVCAVRFGGRPPGAAAAAALYGLCLLVRESALVGLPALVAALWLGRLRVFFLTLSLFLAGLYVPLSLERSIGFRFWEQPWGAAAAGPSVVEAAVRGDLAGVFAAAAHRAAFNLEQYWSPATTTAERATLAVFAVLPLLALPHVIGSERRLLTGLFLSWAAFWALLVFVYVAVWWGGLRYIMFLLPPFLPWVVQTLVGARPARAGARFGGGWLLLAALALLLTSINAQILGVLTRFKETRQARQEGLTRYVERYVEAGQLSRVVVENGMHFGLSHYPVEVVVDAPEDRGQLQELERVVWFDYLVLRSDRPLARKLGRRSARYQRRNADDPEAELAVFERLR